MMTKTQDGNIRYWALTASIVIHSAALAVFTGVKMTGYVETVPAQRPAVSLQAIEHIVEQPPLPHPKPQVETILPATEPEHQPPLLASPEEPQPLPIPEPVQPAAPAEVVWQPAPAVNQVEFFGQKSIVQQICYVVDCSGSMYGRMYQVRQQLKESILKLNSQQAFAVVFFMEGRKILASGDGQLEPATARAKSQALTLIDSIRPGGSTDAAHAIECALRLKDASGGGPELVYFLTDGFDLDTRQSMLFVDNVQRLVNSLAPGVVLHTIGFDSQPQDRQMLQRLAADTGGEFIEVK